jgi:hypothetical protein
VVAGEVVVPGLPGYDAVHKPATARFREQSDRDLPVPCYWLGACVSDGQPRATGPAQQEWQQLPVPARCWGCAVVPGHPGDVPGHGEGAHLSASALEVCLHERDGHRRPVAAVPQPGHPAARPGEFRARRRVGQPGVIRGRRRYRDGPARASRAEGTWLQDEPSQCSTNPAAGPCRWTRSRQRPTRCWRRSQTPR